jgi:cardiolipin synthase
MSHRSQLSVLRYVVYSTLLSLCILIPAFANPELLIEPNQGAAPLLNAITSAKQSIDLVMYGLTDLEFVSALKQAMNYKKRVRVLLQHYPYKADGENEKAIAALQQEHIPLAWPSDDFQLTHQKTFILDHQTALILTFNLTHSSFKNERNFALKIDDPLEVTEIQTVFNADWQHQRISVHEANLIWSPDNSREKIMTLIANARNELHVYAESISDYGVIGALAKAARRGVSVYVLTSTHDQTSPNKKFAYLQRAGVHIIISKHYYIHAKAMIIDNQTAMLGSINFTKASIDKNRELSVITHDAAVISALQTLFSLDCDSTNLHKQSAIKQSTLPLIVIHGIKQLSKWHKTFSHAYKPHHHKRRRLRKKTTIV